MKKEQIYLSTIDENAAALAREFGLGLEIAEYCTAWNMDDPASEVHDKVNNKVSEITNRILHGPFNELFPCAIDPKARNLAKERYLQAANFAKKYHAKKLVLHGGYHPRIYYPEWYIEQSILFWKAFLEEETELEIVLENVYEEEPEYLLQIIQGVDHPNLRMCLDIGHVHTYSSRSVWEWLELYAPYIRHFHIHNNDGTWDTHSAVWDGTIPMKEFLEKATELCKAASVTLELPEAEASIKWLIEQNLLEV